MRYLKCVHADTVREIEKVYCALIFLPTITEPSIFLMPEILYAGDTNFMRWNVTTFVASRVTAGAIYTKLETPKTIVLLQGVRVAELCT